MWHSWSIFASHASDTHVEAAVMLETQSFLDMMIAAGNRNLIAFGNTGHSLVAQYRDVPATQDQGINIDELCNGPTTIASEIMFQQGSVTATGAITQLPQTGALHLSPDTMILVTILTPCKNEAVAATGVP